MKTFEKVLLAAIISLLIISVATVAAFADDAVAVNGETDVEALFRDSLDELAGYWEYGEEYMVYFANGKFVSYDNAGPVDVSAEEYEQVLNKYFNVGTDNLERIRNGGFGATYNEQEQTYTLQYVGGFGGALPKREYINYVGNPSSGYRLEVYYRDIVYSFLRDALPSGTNEYEYASEHADPETGEVEYGGFVYKDGPEGYYRISSYADTGKIYYVWYEGDYIQISGVSDADYVEDFTYMILDDNEIAVTKYFGKDKVVHLSDSYVIDGKTYTVTRIAGAFAWVDCVDALYLPTSINTIDGWSFAYVVGPIVFYEGTQEQWDAIDIGSPQSFFGPHIGYTKSDFGEQDCWYCPCCDLYMLEDGTDAPAYVYFYDWDGTFLQKSAVYYKETYNEMTSRVVGPTPTREMDDVYRYNFSGWDKPLDDICTGSMHLTAQYQEIYRQYRIEFRNYDGTILPGTEDYYVWGSEPKASYAVPFASKPSDEIYCYTFAGWDKEVVPCAGNAVYTAVFKADYVDYTVRFWNENQDQVLSEGVYHWGDTIVLPANPTKDTDSMYVYTFVGWQKFRTEEYGMELICYGESDYYPVFSYEHVIYNAIWKDWDGTILHQTTFPSGSSPDFVPPNPTREPDNEYTYTFFTWVSQDDGSGNKTWVAQYDSEQRWYLITFKDWNGNVIGEQSCYWGDEIYPPVPYRPDDELYTYTFIGWDNEVVPCAGDATYTAVYSFEPVALKKYTVIFNDENGTVISRAEYLKGETVIVPEAPVKAADNIYTYTFAGWDSIVAPTCFGNATYTATYTSTYIEYTIIFKNWDGTVISTKTRRWGAGVVAPQKVSRNPDETYTYEFVGWDNEVVPCAGDATYTAIYEGTYIDYTVTFKDWDGTVLSAETYHYGDALTAPAVNGRAADEAYTYSFSGWDNELICTGNKTYTAIYTPVYINYTVVFKNWDGSVISSATYHWGDTVTVPENPTRPSMDNYVFEFSGWDQEIIPCKGNMVYTAVYASSDIPQVPESITSSDYDISEGFVSKVVLGTSVADFCEKIHQREYIKVYKGDKEVSGNTTMATGMVVKLMDGNEEKASAIVVVKGDANGDGKISALDYVRVKRYCLRTLNLGGPEMSAADVTKDGKVNTLDYIRIKRHCLKTYVIE